MHVLIADDYHDAADSLARIIRLWGHSCDVAYDGPASLKLAADRRSDVALLDIGMPKMDGYTVGRQLLTMYPGLPIYAVTGHGRIIDIAKTQEAGFTGHFLKPVDLAALQQIL